MYTFYSNLFREFSAHIFFKLFHPLKCSSTKRANRSGTLNSWQKLQLNYIIASDIPSSPRQHFPQNGHGRHQKATPSRFVAIVARPAWNRNDYHVPVRKREHNHYERGGGAAWWRQGFGRPSGYSAWMPSDRMIIIHLSLFNNLDGTWS